MPSSVCGRDLGVARDAELRAEARRWSRSGPDDAQRRAGRDAHQAADDGDDLAVALELEARDRERAVAARVDDALDRAFAAYVRPAQPRRRRPAARARRSKRSTSRMGPRPGASQLLILSSAWRRCRRRCPLGAGTDAADEPHRTGWLSPRLGRAAPNRRQPPSWTHRRRRRPRRPRAASRARASRAASKAAQAKAAAGKAAAAKAEVKKAEAARAEAARAEAARAEAARAEAARAVGRESRGGRGRGLRGLST